MKQSSILTIRNDINISGRDACAEHSVLLAGVRDADGRVYVGQHAFEQLIRGGEGGTSLQRGF